MDTSRPRPIRPLGAGWDDKSWTDVNTGVATALNGLRALEDRLGGGGGGIDPNEALRALKLAQAAIEFAEAAANWAAD